MVQITPTVDSFLDERPTATLGTIMRDGSPQASVLFDVDDPQHSQMAQPKA
jgi:hypothetical protein